MTPKKFSLIPGNISRFFILMVIVLLATMGVMIQSAVNAWLRAAPAFTNSSIMIVSKSKSSTTLLH